MRQVLAVVATVLVCVVSAAPATAARIGALNQSRPVTVGARLSYPTVPAALRATVTLTARSPDGPVGFGEVASSAQTIAANGVDLQNLSVETGVYVFGKPAAGWSGAVSPANLTAANGDRLGAVAASDTAVVAGDAALGNAGPVTAFVFTRPNDRWSGSHHEAAKLVGPLAGSGYRAGPLVAISGDTVFMSDGDSVYAFNEPSGGWTGTPPVSATLTPSSPGYISSFAVSGNTLVARSGESVYVFTKPSAGWSGSLHESATITLPGLAGIDHAVAISGQTIMATGPFSTSQQSESVYVAQQPAGGWTTQHQPRFATLQLPVGVYSVAPTIQISGGTAVLSTASPEEHQCFPCTGRIYAVSQPKLWSGTTQLAASTSLSNVAGPPAGALAGQTLVAAALDGIHLYTVSRPSTIASVKLTNLRSTDPRLVIGIAQARGGQPVTGVTLTLPSAVRLNTKFIRGIRVSGLPRRHLRIDHNTVVVSLVRPAAHFTITIGDGALAKTPSLSAQVTKLAQTKRQRHRLTRLDLKAQIRGSDGGSTPALIALTVS